MSIELFGLENIPIVDGSSDISKIIKEAIEKQGCGLHHGDIVLIAETLISKAEENFIKLDELIPMFSSYETKYEKILLKAKYRKDAEKDFNTSQGFVPIEDNNNDLGEVSENEPTVSELNETVDESLSDNASDEPNNDDTEPQNTGE